MSNLTLDQIDIALLTHLGWKDLVIEPNNRIYGTPKTPDTRPGFIYDNGIPRPTRSLDACYEIENNLGFKQRQDYYKTIKYTHWIRSNPQGSNAEYFYATKPTTEAFICAPPDLRAEALVRTLGLL